MRRFILSAMFVLVGAVITTDAAEQAAQGGHGTVDPPAPDSIVPGPQDTASGALHALQTWGFGGIGGTWLAVGQPNTLNRDDRAVFRFDVAMYLVRGKVTQATLRMDVTPQSRGETFRLDHYTVERFVLSAKDVGSGLVEKVASFEVVKGSPAGLPFSFDVTAQVNRDLESGFGFSAFRLRSEFAETSGNPDNTPSLITITNGTLALEINP